MAKPHSTRGHAPRAIALARRGSLMAEVVVALLLLTAMISIVARLAVNLSRQQATRHAHATARQEAANLMAQAFAVPWERLEEEELAGLPLSATARQHLAGVEQQITVETRTEAGEPLPLEVKEVVVELSWNAAAQGTRQQVTLAARRHRAAEESP